MTREISANLGRRSRAGVEGSGWLWQVTRGDQVASVVIEISASAKSGGRSARWSSDDFLGDRFWGQVQGPSGRLKALRGRGAAGKRTSRVAGKALQQALFISRVAEARTSMVRRGSTVRVRQRALMKCLQISISCQRFMQHAGTSRVRLWYSRRRATSRDASDTAHRYGIEARSRERPASKHHLLP
jgi:hypothetical protein